MVGEASINNSDKVFLVNSMEKSPPFEYGTGEKFYDKEGGSDDGLINTKTNGPTALIDTTPQCSQLVPPVKKSVSSKVKEFKKNT